MGRPIVDAEAVYRAVEARSLLDLFDALKLTASVPPPRLAELRAAAGPLDALTRPT
jgi:hypothetical protein